MAKTWDVHAHYKPPALHPRRSLHMPLAAVRRSPPQRVYKTVFCQRPTVIKERFIKRYRHPTLDAKLRDARLKQVRQVPALRRCCPPPRPSPSVWPPCLLLPHRARRRRLHTPHRPLPSLSPWCPQEVRSMLRARKMGVLAPVVYFTELETSSIYMELVAGPSIKQVLMDKLLDDAGACGGEHPLPCLPEPW